MSESEFKIQPAVVAEITVHMPDGQSFVAANLTVQFVSTMNGAKVLAEQFVMDWKNKVMTEHTRFVGGVVGTLQETVAVGCKVTTAISYFPVRVEQEPTPNPKTGWGSNGN